MLILRKLLNLHVATMPKNGKYILDTQKAYILSMDAPKTVQEAIVYFSEPERAFEYAKKFRWPNGKVACPRCGSEKHSFIKTRRIWFCYSCQKQFTLKLGMIFEDSPLGLDKWMTAFWMLINCKNGVSSCEVARSLGITQKSAWFMVHGSGWHCKMISLAVNSAAKLKWTNPSLVARHATCT